MGNWVTHNWDSLDEAIVFVEKNSQAAPSRLPPRLVDTVTTFIVWCGLSQRNISMEKANESKYQERRDYPIRVTDVKQEGDCR